MNPTIHRLATLAAIIAFCVIVLGAWVRLSHAGLGCPDWPGCYGQLTWPEAPHEITTANESFPERPFESNKAWREMVHRYLAGTLMLLVSAMAWMVWHDPRAGKKLKGLTASLVVLIIFQALLGMWTVTLKLKPIIVMAHLLGGMISFSLILWLMFAYSQRPSSMPDRNSLNARTAIMTAIAVLAIQIALGGWTSANYAALSCPDVPMCTGQWWPDADFGEGFIMWREIGVDYEGGVLDHKSRVAVHLAHRVGAVVTLSVLLLLSMRLLKSPRLRAGGRLLISLVLAQFTLGVLNVALHLPLANAVAHNAGAVLLLANLLWLLNKTGTREY